jgi:hypothetical protein
MSKSVSASINNIRKKEFFPYEIIIEIKDSKETATQLRDTTLALCKAYRIPPNKISVLVETKNAEKQFKEILIPGTFGRVVSETSVNELFPLGTPLVFMKSYITGFFEYNEKAPEKKQALKSLLGVLKLGFLECEKANAYLWGVGTKNALKPSVSTGLKYISDIFWGCIHTGIATTLGSVSDYERILLSYKSKGAVVRLNGFSVTCGLAKKIKEADCIRLFKLYPNYVRLRKTAKGEVVPVLIQKIDEEGEG